jgi:Ran GTPase-activating protein 1
MDSTQGFQPRTFSIKLWPPSERLMLVERMTKTMSTESIFSRKYGLLGKQEAHENAKRIEELCFASADEHFKNEPDGDGSSAVQLYAKESSKMMLEVLRKGPRTAAELETPIANTSLVSPDAPRVLADTVLDISGGERVLLRQMKQRNCLVHLPNQGIHIK